MLLRAFYVLPLLHPYADRSTSIGEAALQGRECQYLPSSSSLVSVSVLLGMNKSNSCETELARSNEGEFNGL